MKRYGDWQHTYLIGKKYLYSLKIRLRRTEGGPHRRTQSAGDPAVTVITIGSSDTGNNGSGNNNGGILPSVLRGKPRVVATGVGGGGGRPVASLRPDVSTPRKSKH